MLSPWPVAQDLSLSGSSRRFRSRQRRSVHESVVSHGYVIQCGAPKRDVCWFITPSTVTSSWKKYHKANSYCSYKRTNLAIERGPHIVGKSSHSHWKKTCNRNHLKLMEVIRVIPFFLGKPMKNHLKHGFLTGRMGYVNLSGKSTVILRFYGWLLY